MAVYKRGYEPYSGPLTREWPRFLVIARHAYGSVFESRFMLLFFFVCAIYPIALAIIIYLPFNGGAAALLKGHRILESDPRLFLHFLNWQGGMAYMLAGFLGPGLIAPDLANGALPLYFSRPFSRAEYVLGKMSVLAILISAITWVPGLLLFGFAAYLEGPRWLAANYGIAAAVFFGSWLWIAALCLLAMALSAWVKWRVAAGALIFAVFFVAAGFGEAIRESMHHTSAGRLLNLAADIETIWGWMLGVDPGRDLSPWSAFLALAVVCGLCYWLLARKLRAYHVERA
jgi:ABC-2 type transport system permease protein